MGRVHLGDLGVYEMILSKWILKKWDREACIVLYCLWIGRGCRYL